MQIVGAPGSTAAYKGMVEGTYKIALSEGVRSLWRGMSSVVVGAGEFLRVVLHHLAVEHICCNVILRR